MMATIKGLYLFCAIAAALPCAACNEDHDVSPEGNERHAYFVSPGGSDANSGRSASEPLLSLQAAVNLAVRESRNKVIYLAEGTLSRGSGLNAADDGVIIENTDKLELSGGWNADFSAQTGTTVLNGGGIESYRVMRVAHCYRIYLSNLSVSGGNLSSNTNTAIGNIGGFNDDDLTYDPDPLTLGTLTGAAVISDNKTDTSANLSLTL